MFECVFDHKRSCAALTERECINCSFQKTKCQLTADRNKAKKRILHLPEDLKKHIVDKYYCGRIL